MKPCDEGEIFVPELEGFVGETTRLPWTDEARATVVKYYPLGVSVERIAKAVGHEVSATRNMITQLGLRRLPRNDIEARHPSPSQRS